MRLPLLLAVALLAAPASAAAAPPPNDHYLASTTVTAHAFRDGTDTTEATTQADTFNPSRDGLPTSGGGEPEPTSCGTGTYGRTAWWDFEPPSDGRLEIRADGRRVVVVLNGKQVVDADLDHFLKDPAVAKEHPGLKRASGRIGLQSHSERVEFRNVRIKTKGTDGKGQKGT